jgi:hypothetical protein
MPEISRFLGIVIRMYREAGEPHNSPHFHAHYQEDVAIYAIRPIEILAGSLPLRQQRFVEAWAELHQEELLRDWNLLVSGHRPLPIEPLN